MLDQLRLESYGFCCKLRVTTAVSLLGWAGIITSVLAIIAGILVTVVQSTVLVTLETFLPSGIIMISIFPILLIMSIFLVKRNRDGSYSEVKSILQVICKLLLSLELIVSLGLFISMVTLVSSHHLSLLDDPVLLSIFIGSLTLVLVWMVFLPLAIHGIRKNKKSLLRAHIIFTLGVILMQIVISILSFFTQTDETAGMAGVSILLSIVYFIYHLGYFVILYNIMDVRLDIGQEMKPV